MTVQNVKLISGALRKNASYFGLTIFLIITALLTPCYGKDDLKSLHNRFLKLEGNLEAERAAVDEALLLIPQTPDATVDKALLLEDMGHFYRAVAEYDSAIRFLTDSVNVSTSAVGRDDDLTASIINSLGVVYEDMGDYSKAVDCYKDALRIKQERLGSEHPRTAVTLANLGGVYEHMGDYVQAEDYLERAVSILDKTVGPTHHNTALAVTHLGQLFSTKGDYDRAVILFKRALSIEQRAHGTNHPDTAFALSNLASVYAATGQYIQADRLFHQTLTIRESLLGNSHPKTAQTLFNLGLLAERQRKLADAENYYQRALVVWTQRFESSHFDSSEALERLAFLKARQGRYHDALELFSDTLQSQRYAMANLFSVASEDQKMAFAVKHYPAYFAFLSLIHQHFLQVPEAVTLGFNAVLSRKGLVFDVQSRQFDSLIASENQQTRELMQELIQSKRKMSKLLQQPQTVLVNDKTILDLQTHIKSLESDIASQTGSAPLELARQVTAEKVQQHLHKNAVLVDFVRIVDFNWRQGHWEEQKRYLAFVVHNTGPVVLINLGDADTVEALVMDALVAFREEPLGDIGKQLSAARTLYDVLWRPLAGLIGHAQEIVVIPDGILNLVPFAALMASTNKFLIEEHVVAYATSSQDLLYGNLKVTPESDLFVLADPAFDDRSAISDTSDTINAKANLQTRWNPLDGTSIEADLVANLISGTKKQVLKGPNATEAALVKVRSPRILHLATHGFFNAGDPETILAKVEWNPWERVPRVLGDRLMQSGLVLAGGNYAAQSSSSDDGLLFALEISGMNLHQTDIVVLSACSTALGEILAGEGVFGLRRAFALAGARNLVMTLWPVKDKYVLRLVRHFYELLEAGRSPVLSLAEAQRKEIVKLKKAFSAAPPALWAGFIVQSKGQSNN